MRYQTRRESFRFLSLYMFIIGMLYCVTQIVLRITQSVHEIDFTTFLIKIITTSLLVSFFFIYCYSSRWKRRRFKNKGERFDGHIIGAEMEIRGRGVPSFYLKIEFIENGQKKILLSEGYAGDPSSKLRSLRCDIYKLHDKYIEANLDVRNRKEPIIEVHIPISKYRNSSRKKNGYV